MLWRGQLGVGDGEVVEADPDHEVQRHLGQRAGVQRRRPRTRRRVEGIAVGSASICAPPRSAQVRAPVGQVQIAELARVARGPRRPPPASPGGCRRSGRSAPRRAPAAAPRAGTGSSVKRPRGRGAAHRLVEVHATRTLAVFRPARSTCRGRTRGDREGSTSRVTTLFAPITQRSPMLTPLVTTTFAPSQQLSPMRVGPLLVEALPGDRPLRIVEAVGGVRDEAAVGEHAVVADLDQLLGGDHHAHVQELPAPMRTRALPGSGDPHVRLEQHAGARSPGAPRAAPPARCRGRGQRTNASRRMNSQWIRARFHGSELRSYQRHFCAHRRSRPRERLQRIRSCRRFAAAASPPPALRGRLRLAGLARREASELGRNCPVCEAGSAATSSGVPAATAMPPSSPPSGPMSIRPVGALDHVEVVLDHDHAVACVHEPLEHLQQPLDVGEVQPGGRLVEDVEGPAGGHLRELGGELDPLRLAARQRRRRLAEADIAEPDGVERLQPPADLGDVLEEASAPPRPACRARRRCCCP